MFNAQLFETAPADVLPAIKRAIASKGPYKGYISLSAPKSNTPAYAARQALLMSINPYKVSIGGTMFMSDEQKEIYGKVLAWIDSLPRSEAIKLDKDRECLQGLGVW